MGRKNQTMMPLMNTGGGAGRRAVATLVAVVLLALLLRDPVAAASTVRQVWSWGGSVIDALSAFGSALSK